MLPTNFEFCNTIIGHPAAIKALRKSLSQHTVESAKDGVLFDPARIDIIEDVTLSETKQSMDKRGNLLWKRGKVLPDTKLMTWVSDEDIINPSSWQIHFKLVIPQLEYQFYFINKKYWTLDDIPTNMARAL